MKNPGQKQGTSNTCTIEKAKRSYTQGEQKMLNNIKTIEKAFDINVYDYVKENYKKGYDKLLEMDDTKLDEELFDILNSCIWQKENRTLCEFGTNTMLSWIMQDKIEDKARGFIINGTIKSNGVDARREFVKGSKVTGETDMLIDIRGKQYHIEIVADYGQYWAKNKPIDLRDFKLTSLIKKAGQHEKVYVLALSLPRKEFALIEILKDGEYDLTQTFHFIYKRYCQKLPINYKKEFQPMHKLGITIFEGTQMEYNKELKNKYITRLALQH